MQTAGAKILLFLILITIGNAKKFITKMLKTLKSNETNPSLTFRFDIIVPFASPIKSITILYASEQPFKRFLFKTTIMINANRAGREKNKTLCIFLLFKKHKNVEITTEKIPAQINASLFSS